MSLSFLSLSGWERNVLNNDVLPCTGPWQVGSSTGVTVGNPTPSPRWSILACTSDSRVPASRSAQHLTCLQHRMMLLVSSPVMPASPYWVVATDYENYALVYSCTSFFWLFHVDYAWIRSRTPQLHPETVEHLKSVLRSYRIQTGMMLPTDQMNCPSDM